MSLRKRIKFLSQQLGFFFPLRELQQRLDPAVRAQVRKDMTLYAPFIGPETLVFDIGANLGQKAQTFVKLGRKVVCVEPNPMCADYLRRKFAGDPVEIVEAALGDVPGQAVLNFISTASTASLRADWAHFEGDQASLQRREVPVSTLDQLIADHGIPGFMKIDVEGYEDHVLSGLSQPVACLSLEYAVREMNRIRTCLDMLNALGRYEFNAIEMNGQNFYADRWLDADAIIAAMEQSWAPPSGDIFARLAG